MVMWGESIQDMLMYMMDVGMELEILHGSRKLEFTDSLGLVNMQYVLHEAGF